ncbi:MAG: response regulator [Candidatus Thiodiazotropha sp. (ex Dulcina madagascariensis)]|nr:response regulator [Candidatus Thiodiazotropha sp. (ex Dulcina madagascariensis)]
MDLSYRVLIVDDVPDNIQVAMNILKEENYYFSFATNGEEALTIIENDRFDLVLLDIMMPGIDGFEVCRRLKADEKTKDIPVIFLTAKVDADSISRGFVEGAVDYLTKPFHPTELLARVKNHLELYTAKKVLNQHNLELKSKARFAEKRMLSELEESQKEMIYAMTGLIESVSDETGQHSRRVSELSYLLAHYHPSLKDEDAETIYHATPLHDLGKMAIPPAIIQKPGRLTDEEYLIVKGHSAEGHKILKHSKRKTLKTADIIAYEHHEKWDGSGYPRGLKGEEIHLYGRIVALADVFEAITHKRAYKKAWSIDKAVSYINEHRGKQFDPQLVDIFMEHLDELSL